MVESRTKQYVDGQFKPLARWATAGAGGTFLDHPAFVRKNDKWLLISEDVPEGTIVAIQGSPSSLPEGWAPCDGTNGTPDLRDRFIIGAGGGLAVGAIGGAEEVVLTEDHLPAHSHDVVNFSAVESHSHAYTTVTSYYSRDTAPSGTDNSTDDDHTYQTQTSSSDAHSHNISLQPEGGGEAHNNMPPFYALFFVMRTGGGHYR